jgi:holo-[acyl-carrier protein] synthase
MQVKTGIDICEISRIKKITDEYGFKFINRILTKTEQNKCIKDGIFLYAKIAKRFAAKEAFAKATGLGIGEISFLDIELVSDSNNAPEIIISQNAKSVLASRKNWQNYNFSVSLTDDANMAVASVVVLILDN